MAMLDVGNAYPCEPLNTKLQVTVQQDADAGRPGLPVVMISLTMGQARKPCHLGVQPDVPVSWIPVNPGIRKVSGNGAIGRV